MRASSTVNTYFAMLVITIVASGAALIIVHVGTAGAYQVSAAGDTAAYLGS